jgi:hypothetical protein
MQGALDPLPDWQGDMLADPSRQAWLGKIPVLPGAACPIDQPEWRKVSYSKLLLRALMKQKANGFQRIITGDESWFFLDYLRDSVWEASRDQLPQNVMQEKCLISIL